MKTKVLEVNVDDLNMGGVFNLVKNVLYNKTPTMQIDIASIEKFAKHEHIQLLNKLGTTVHYIGYEGNKWKKQIIPYIRLKSLLNNNFYDCVHIHSDVANKLFIFGLAAKMAKTKKIILHSHASGVDGNHRKIKTFVHKLCRLFLKNVGTDFVACSDLAAKWMFPNIKKEMIVIINNGVDLDKFRFSSQIRKTERKKLGIKEELLIGHVGRFCYQKNHNYLIEIISEMKKQGMPTKLLLIGEGPDKDAIKRKVYEKSLEKYVIFYGISEQIQNLFFAMDLFILPSHFEGLPIAGVEAQAAGLPVIFSDKITREAQLTTYVKYLNIKQSNVKEWVKCICQLSNKKILRTDAYDELKGKKFSIQDTAKNFFALYKNIN